MANPVFDLLASRARTAPSEPVLTFVASDGSRTELSAVTLLNAVSKAANLLRDDYDVGPGTPVALTIPWHWQRVPWLLAVLALGGEPAFGHDARADVELGSAASLAGSPSRDRLAVSLHPLGLPDPALPEGLVDAAVEVRLHPDLFLPDAIDTATVRTAIAAASQAAFRVDRGSRVLMAGPPEEPWFLPALLPLAAGASVVLAESADDAERIAASEAVTARW